MPRQLHIGGTVRSEGWEVFNVSPAPCVDHVGNAKDLSRFTDGTFSTIYASHVLEHFDYTGELTLALKEWHRVLEPGGKLYVSVPDLDVLATLFLARNELSMPERFCIMRMMFGGHVDAYDFHVAGLNEEFLAYFLHEAGYANIRRVEQFDSFQDTSRLNVKGVVISLNMIAEKLRVVPGS